MQFQFVQASIYSNLISSRYLKLMKRYWGALKEVVNTTFVGHSKNAGTLVGPNNNFQDKPRRGFVEMKA